MIFNNAKKIYYYQWYIFYYIILRLIQASVVIINQGLGVINVTQSAGLLVNQINYVYCNITIEQIYTQTRRQANIYSHTHMYEHLFANIKRVTTFTYAYAYAYSLSYNVRRTHMNTRNHSQHTYSRVRRMVYGVQCNEI